MHRSHGNDRHGPNAGDLRSNGTSCRRFARLFNEAHQKEDHTGPDHGAQNLTQHAAKNENANAWQKPTADNGTNNANDDVTDKTETTALHDLTGEPASNCANDEPDKQRFDSHLLFSIETTRHKTVAHPSTAIQAQGRAES